MATEKVLGSSGVSVIKEIMDEKIGEVDKRVGTLTDLETTAKDNLVNAVNEVRGAISAGGTAAQITLDTSTTTEGYLKSYTIKQGSTTVGTIDIPKDLVVTSGSVVANPEGQTEGTYIKLVIANQTDPLYINVGSLVDIYTAKASATQIQLAIDSSTREISASIVEGAVGTTELSENAVTTVKIADANVTLAKLATDVVKRFTDIEAKVTALETKVGDGIEFLTEEEIRAIFASTT